MARPDAPDLIGVRNLHVERSPGAPPAIGDLSVTCPPGERIAVMGANGSGKSTLLAAIVGLIPARMSWRRIPEPIGIVFQHPDIGWTASSVAGEIRFALACRGVSGPTAEARVDAALGALDLDGFRDRAPETLSGGEQQRLQFAATTAPGLRTLLLDEPAAFLDPASASALEMVIDQLDPAPELLIRVTHDPHRALRADRLLVLAAGELVADGPPSVVLADPRVSGWGIEAPDPTRIAAGLRAAGRDPGPTPVTWAELEKAWP